MKLYDLKPSKEERAKSFYGKAEVLELDSGEFVLMSYKTEVCKVDTCGNVIRLWNGYSLTTMRHVKSFLSLFGIECGGKAWWDRLPVTT